MGIITDRRINQATQQTAYQAMQTNNNMSYIIQMLADMANNIALLTQTVAQMNQTLTTLRSELCAEHQKQ